MAGCGINVLQPATFCIQLGSDELRAKMFEQFAFLLVVSERPAHGYCDFHISKMDGVVDLRDCAVEVVSIDVIDSDAF